MKRPEIGVTGFHMRNDIDGKIEVLIRHNDKWLVVFGNKGPGPVARDTDQTIDHMIHAGGIQNLIDHGHIHGGNNLVTPARAAQNGPVRGRTPKKPDRRGGDRRATKRRTDDKRTARLK